MLKNALSFIALVLTMVVIFIGFENNFVSSFDACISQKAPDHGKLGLQTICTVRLIDRHAGFFGMLAGFIVAFFTFTLWRSTDKLWKAGRDALEATERAFIFIDGFNYELTTALDAKIEPANLLERYRSDPGFYITRFAAQPKWKNIGNTPTKKMTIRVDWRGPLGPVPPDYVYKNPPEPFFLAPKAIEPSVFIEMPGVQALVDYGMNPLGDPPLMFIWGRADYEDIFKRPHFIEWCYCVRLDRHDGKKLRASFIQWGEYNRTDEDN